MQSFLIIPLYFPYPLQKENAKLSYTKVQLAFENKMLILSGFAFEHFTLSECFKRNTEFMVCNQLN